MVVSGKVYKQRTCISKINNCRTESKSKKVKNNGNTHHDYLHMKITIELIPLLF